ncbi:MAG: phosphoribosylformylglycinamidine synthase subunit PurS [Candidatus Methylomirabilales bacterium]
MIRAKVYITLKKGVLDPQGDTVKSALENLGFQGIKEVRMGKFMVITLNSSNLEQTKAQVDEMCRKLLANPVIEDYEIAISDQPSAVSHDESSSVLRADS